MIGFADATGLSPPGVSPRRYLWTDAFAVCNFLELHRRTGEKRFKRLAKDLINQVHRILGRHRGDDRRTGWISGLGEREGALHPTAGGLRIGKPLPERGPGEPLDERLEWDRDGQYYHYLTKWMHALRQAGAVLGEADYLRWAVELAEATHAAFVYRTPAGSRQRMYWKMSIDLSRPLVPSMGLHDPLDGWITCSELQAAVKGLHELPTPPLGREIAALSAMCAGINWGTDDPLGLGGLLADAYRVGQLAARGDFAPGELTADLLDASLRGLAAFSVKNSLALPAAYRLAFRELGLSIGLHGVRRLRTLIEENPGISGNGMPLHGRVEALLRYERLASAIEAFWLDAASREASSWRDHGDINDVMLATSLAPDGFLKL
ncbi:MAG: hypothetical protein A4E73_04047 [Syntrophaceae bacterium PtaU1.Bin231]|nr:MAG: hypothetical protein A4E73_04047 [Syntrophaceae bacterium PtaU1.Bin231]